jgi:hypothetical protein
MKKILLSLAAIGVVATAAAPAAAEPWRDYRHDGYHQSHRDSRLTVAHLDRLDERVRMAARRHQISWPEARQLRKELRFSRGKAVRYQNGTISRDDRRRLAETVDRVEMRVSRQASNDYPRHGYGERTDWRR